MNMEELKKYHQEKEHLARHEGKHPANHSEKHRIMKAHDDEMNEMDHMEMPR